VSNRAFGVDLIVMTPQSPDGILSDEEFQTMLGMALEHMVAAVETMYCNPGRWNCEVLHENRRTGSAPQAASQPSPGPGRPPRHRRTSSAPSTGETRLGSSRSSSRRVPECRRISMTAQAQKALSSVVLRLS
jgi:hypothetical protein